MHFSFLDFGRRQNLLLQGFLSNSDARHKRRETGGQCNSKQMTRTLFTMLQELRLFFLLFMFNATKLPEFDTNYHSQRKPRYPGKRESVSEQPQKHNRK
jgi:hypothetical protein